jgi:phosphotransferase system enzyme I (PtsP)
MALIGIGIERLSITPAAVGPVKAMVRSVDIARLRAAVAELLVAPKGSLREPLIDWARENGVQLP